jgi:tetratricopeptide (TPR) repeat protein
MKAPGTAAHNHSVSGLKISDDDQWIGGDLAADRKSMWDGQHHHLLVLPLNSKIVLDGLDPDSAAAGDIHMRMGETYRRMGRIDAAIAEFRLAKNLLPDRESVVVSTLALCLDSAGRWEEAEREYQAAIRIDPNNAASLNNLAYLLSQHGGDLNRALTYAKRAAELMPQLPEVSDTLGTIYLAHGMNGAALNVFRQNGDETGREGAARCCVG